MLYEDVTEKIIKAFYEVYNILGYGFLEKVYENALIQELGNVGLKVQPQFRISVLYKGRIIGDYYADVFVDDKVIVELKSAELIAKEHQAQLLNYLKGTNMKPGLLLNFGKKPEFKRIIN